ncbi:hypothetical protein [Sphingomonas sp. PB4P5]|uniref:hypothetical protein n=1 Tax=Parasphingomonas puruogangriensis TaxID=3096155 RepID=UPI002FC81C1B
MTENVEQLILGYLNRIQATFDRMDRVMDGDMVRLSTLKGGPSSIAQSGVPVVAATEAQQSLNAISLRLDRIERRLELND